jgi:hypothetical protein
VVYHHHEGSKPPKGSYPQRFLGDRGHFSRRFHNRSIAEYCPHASDLIFVLPVLGSYAKIKKGSPAGKPRYKFVQYINGLPTGKGMMMDMYSEFDHLSGQS